MGRQLLLGMSPVPLHIFRETRQAVQPSSKPLAVSFAARTWYLTTTMSKIISFVYPCSSSTLFPFVQSFLPIVSHVSHCSFTQFATHTDTHNNHRVDAVCSLTWLHGDTSRRKLSFCGYELAFAVEMVVFAYNVLKECIMDTFERLLRICSTFLWLKRHHMVSGINDHFMKAWTFSPRNGCYSRLHGKFI